MGYLSEYEKWVKSPYIDEATRGELIGIKNNEEETRERFCKYLEFGTAGLRGLIGAGTNRMNVYTVGRATLGLANHIISRGADYAGRGVVIAYDPRRLSYEFALRAALVLCAKGIRAYLFDDIRPTPLLSYAIRDLNTTAGIVVTASHNPPEYNGFKLYWEDGGQIIDKRAAWISEEILKINDVFGVPAMDKEKALREGLLITVGQGIDENYIEKALTLNIEREMIKNRGKNLGIVYTPLHGTGYRLVTSVLKRAGFSRVHTVPEQREPHSEFPTVKSPNPEERKALELAIDTASLRGAELVAATDPDADRLGIASKNRDGSFEVFTGNQLGILLVDYILSRRRERGMYTHGDTIIKSIVTSEMGRVIAASFGVDIIDTLTGFKYIAGRIEEFAQGGQQNFVFGYEESNGYLAGDFVRDKDGITTTLLVCEMALYYKEKGLTLTEVLNGLYEEYGYYMEDVLSIKAEGYGGLQRIRNIMDYFRANFKNIENILGEPVEEIRDYLKGRRFNPRGEITGDLVLPTSEVLYFSLRNNSWVCVRPSGTEPKLKIYFSVTAKDKGAALGRLEDLKNRMDAVIKEILASD